MFFMFLGVCSSPRGPLELSDVSRTSIRLSWQPPSDDGGAPVSAYVIERREVTTQRWVRCARVKPTVTSYVVMNLTEGREYYFRVIAENVEGLGDSLLSENPVQPKRLASKW